jgi:ribosomal protein S18 acetylase RimI-like enzyme
MKKDDFSLSFIKNNAVIIYINSSLFSKCENIISRINEMHRQCFKNDIILNDIDTLVLYMNLENERNKNFLDKMYNQSLEAAFNLVNTNTKNINGSLKVEKYAEHIEIWDVCTHKDWRGKGLMHSLFVDLNQNVPAKYKKFWLNVLFENNSRDEAINLYVKSGFKFDKITYNTPSGKIFNSPVIGFLNIRDDVRKNPSYVKRQIYLALNELKCNFNAELLWEDAIFMQNLYSITDIEYGGTFDLIPKRDINIDERKTFIMKPGKNVIKGEEKKFTVNTPKSTINWHSHPYSCYTTIGCYIMWPSGADMKYIFYNYLNGVLFHLLFTAEGLYTIKLTTQAMKFMYIIYKNSDWLYAFSDLISFRFITLEQYRKADFNEERLDCIRKTNSTACLFSPGEDKNKNIARFLEISNTYSLKQYLINEKDLQFLSTYYDLKNITYNTNEAVEYFENFTGREADFPIFEVKFYTNDYIVKNRRNFEKISLTSINPPFNSFCGPNLS